MALLLMLSLSISYLEKEERLIPLKCGPGRGGLDGYNPVPKTLNP